MTTAQRVSFDCLDRVGALGERSRPHSSSNPPESFNLLTAQCGQCAAKDLECTSNYIEQLQNKPRRPRRFKSNEDKDKESRKSDDDGRLSPPTASWSGAGASRRDSAEASASRDPDSSNSATASASIVNGNETEAAAEKRSFPMAVDEYVSGPQNALVFPRGTDRVPLL